MKKLFLGYSSKAIQSFSSPKTTEAIQKGYDQQIGVIQGEKMNFSSEIEAKIFERTDALRTAYHKTDVFKKWLGYHRVRRQKLSFMRSYANNPHNAYTTRLRRAYAEADILLEMQPVINDHELIVGLPDHTPLTAQEQAEYDELEKVMRAASDTTGLTRGHMALDYEKLIKVGVNGLIKEVTERRAALDINEPENLPKDEFYEGCLVEIGRAHV